MRQPLTTALPHGFLEFAADRATSPTQSGQDSVLAATVSAVSQLSQTRDLRELARGAVDYARNVVGVERIGLFLVKEKRRVVKMLGTWGTDSSGRTVDEFGSAHQFWSSGLYALQDIHQYGYLWRYWSNAHLAPNQRRSQSEFSDRDWFASTPLISRGNVVAVMYNDTALSRTPLDRLKQENLALFASLLAGSVDALNGHEHANPARVRPSPRSALTQYVVAQLEQEPERTARDVARHFGVSPGHLASVFKSEMGASIAEYRNRLRLDRFLALSKNGERNLLSSALEAGFGSYAQFHRVHRMLLGRSPREHHRTPTT